MATSMATAKSVKNNKKAQRLRQEGNELFRKKSFQKAVIKYTESICWAEVGSEEIGLAYGNISAAFHELKEYEFALAYISLAKRHNYPERLMPKLEAREGSCLQLKSQRDDEQKILSNLYPRLAVNVEVNPRIPYIAKDVHVQADPSWGTVVIADRDFKVGDVILHEKSLVGSLNPLYQYQFCDYCFSCMGQGMIPCPHCVSTAYCNEQCLEKSWNTFHRFECDIREELVEAAHYTDLAYTGVRLFLYGLSLFNDNVEKMMEFCKANPRTGSDPMKLDFVNYDPMEEFKTISTARHCKALLGTYPTDFAAAQFYDIYRKNVLMQSLFNDKVKQEFMVRCFLDYLMARPWFYGETLGETTADEFYTIASKFSHKPYDDANLVMVGANGNARLIVHRAVKKGDQLVVQRNMESSTYECKCGGLFCTINVPNRDLNILMQVIDDADINYVAKMNALQQFIQAYSHLFTRCFFKTLMKMYHKFLRIIVEHQYRDELRVKTN